MSAYSAVLFVHSWLRWAVLVVALVLLLRTAAGWLRARPWLRPDEVLQVALTGLLDLQLLVGFVLYLGVSPLVQAFLADPAAGMRTLALRFFAVEHVALMLLAVAAAHVGRVLGKRASTAARRHARACAATAVVLLLLLAAIPWPGRRYGRPLFRTAAALSGATAAGVPQLYHSLI